MMIFIYFNPDATKTTNSPALNTNRELLFQFNTFYFIPNCCDVILARIHHQKVIFMHTLLS